MKAPIEVVKEWNALTNDVDRWKYLIEHKDTSDLILLLDDGVTIVKFKQSGSYSDFLSHMSDELKKFTSHIGNCYGTHLLFDAIGIASDSA